MAGTFRGRSGDFTVPNKQRGDAGEKFKIGALIGADCEIL